MLDSKKKANAKWDQKNKEYKRYIAYRSQARNFITKHASYDDLQELKNLIAEKEAINMYSLTEDRFIKMFESIVVSIDEDSDLTKNREFKGTGYIKKYDLTVPVTVQRTGEVFDSYRINIIFSYKKRRYIVEKEFWNGQNNVNMIFSDIINIIKNKKDR